MTFLDPRRCGCWGIRLWLSFAAVAWGSAASRAADGEVPAPLAPFEYMIGAWKGTGVPLANRIRGWTESHAWAWTFRNGAPAGLSVSIEGGKILAKARLTYEPASKRYVLRGEGSDGKPVTFAGTLDKNGKTLNLDREGATSQGARQRLTIFPNANFVRYTMTLSEQEAGAPQYQDVIRSGVTKAGESFAAGGSAANLPKCVVTGGAATMSVSYQGKSYPLCCSGCRDEFNENPEKYLKKLAQRAAEAPKPAAKAASRVNRDDGAFDGLAPDPSPKPKKPAPGPGAKPSEPMPGTTVEPSGEADSNARASTLLALGQNLEKSGKPAAALSYYRDILKKYPNSPAAATASARVKDLAGR